MVRQSPRLGGLSLPAPTAARLYACTPGRRGACSWWQRSSISLQMDFTNNGSKDHTMIVTWWNAGTPYLSYHTIDTHNRSLSSLLTQYPMPGTRYIPHRT